MSVPAPMVELRTVTKRFGAFAAVDQVSLSIQSGEFLTLLGPSGCGKTTLLRLIAGFEVPDAGQVWLEGSDVTASPPYARNVNQVFQSYALFPHLTVDENIAFGLRRQKLAKSEILRRTKEAIALVALTGFESRQPHQLSGGQRQRVALARALAPRPAVLLLDEPLSALDAKLRRDMQLELKRLQRQLGLTFIFVTHDQEEALTMSDRIAVVKAGRIEQLGSPADIYHTPTTPFVAEFVGSTNLLPFRRVDANSTLLVSDRLTLIAAEGSASASSKGWISIRPEKIQLSGTPLGGPNVFLATIVEEIFTGAINHLRLVTEDGLEIKAMATNDGAPQRAFTSGDRIWVYVAPENIRTLGQ